MRRGRMAPRLFVLMSAMAALFQSVAAQVDPMIQRMADSISIQRLQGDILALERAGGHYSRVNFTPGNDTAAAYLKQAFDAIPGLTSVVDDTFFIASASGGFNTKPLVNVIATIQGSVAPSMIFVVGAHYDCSGSRMGSSWSSQWQTMIVPGADDNATGCAVVLEMARIMSDPAFAFTPQATVQFVAIGAEESGPSYSGSHNGSRHLASAMKTAGQSVIGMVSIDMIGYNPSHLYQSIITNASSTPLASAFAAAAGFYAPQLTVNTSNDATATYSDHDSFWREGYSAICLMENAPPWNSNAYYQANPFYHKSSDTSGTVNLELVRQVARMALAAVSLRVSEIVDVRDRAGMPEGFRLDQNYPNPFNPRTIVSYQLSVASDVKLAVYDILGREVSVLVNERKPPGSYSIEFDGSQLASGTYVYRLVADSYVLSRKMVVVR